MFMKFKKIAFASVGAAALALSASVGAKATTVDVELQLLVDVSGSVSTTEFNLQRDGYVNAFRSTAIKNAITDTSGGRVGKIAAQFIYWSSSNRQAIAVGWTEIGSEADSDAFADAISVFDRPFRGSTRPGDAINFGLAQFTGNGFDGATKVIDVSGDGTGNATNTRDARDAALAAGIDRINGIVIGGSTSVENFYRDNVIGGTDAFLLTADTFGDFEGAVALKLQAEISGGDATASPIPLPAGLPLVLTGFAALGGLGALRRRKEKSAA